MLLQFQFDEPCGEAGTVDGHIDLLENIGDGADVVLVAVGDEEAADAVVLLDEVGDVGDHQVHTVHVVPGKAHAAVHHNDFAAAFIHGHVLADLV